MLILIGYVIGIGLSIFLLYNRKKVWNSDKFRRDVTGILFIIGLIGIFVIDTSAKYELAILFWGLIIPFIYNYFDRLFKRLSFKYQERDFYLYLRTSDEINEFPLDNPHITKLDMLFSFGLIIVIMILVMIPVVLFR